MPIVESTEGIKLWDFQKVLDLSEYLINNHYVYLLARSGLISNQAICKKCSSLMTFRKKSAAKDDFEWRCRLNQSKECSVCSIRDKSWFANGRISIDNILKFIIMWANNYSGTSINSELNLSTRTIVDYKNYARDICVSYESNSLPIGGPGNVVELECFCFDTPKMKNGKCRGVLKDHTKIFAGVERNGRAFAEIITKKDTKTLLDIIKRKIYPSTIIISENKKLFSTLNNEGYKHYTMAHKYFFARDEEGDDDESIRIHTKTVENLWTNLKQQLTATNVNKKNFNSYLQEAIARYNSKDDFLAYFWNAVKQEYPFNAEENPAVIKVEN